MIVWILLQVLGKLVDPGGQNCNLHLRGAGIVFMQPVGAITESFVSFFSMCVSPFFIYCAARAGEPPVMRRETRPGHIDNFALYNIF